MIFNKGDNVRFDWDGIESFGKIIDLKARGVVTLLGDKKKYIDGDYGWTSAGYDKVLGINGGRYWNVPDSRLRPVLNKIRIEVKQ